MTGESARHRPRIPRRTCRTRKLQGTGGTRETPQSPVSRFPRTPPAFPQPEGALRAPQTDSHTAPTPAATETSTPPADTRAPPLRARRGNSPGTPQRDPPPAPRRPGLLPVRPGPDWAGAGYAPALHPVSEPAPCAGSEPRARARHGPGCRGRARRARLRRLPRTCRRRCRCDSWTCPPARRVYCFHCSFATSKMRPRDWARGIALPRVRSKVTALAAPATLSRSYALPARASVCSTSGPPSPLARSIVTGQPRRSPRPRGGTTCTHDIRAARPAPPLRTSARA